MRTVYVSTTSAALGLLLGSDVVPATTDRKKPLSSSTRRHGFLASSSSPPPEPSPTFRPPTSTTGPCVHTLYTSTTPPLSVFEAIIANRTWICDATSAASLASDGAPEWSSSADAGSNRDHARAKSRSPR